MSAHSHECRDSCHRVIVLVETTDFMSERLTLRALAKVAGVSHTTVSLALRNNLSISPDVRRQIHELANQLGYQPDPLVAKVMSSLRFPQEGARRLAFVTRFPDDSWRSRPTFGRTYQAVVKRASLLGYTVDEFSLNAKGMTGRRLSEILDTRAIRGIMISPSFSSRSHISIDFEKLSSVTFGYSVIRPAIHRVANHQIHSLLQAMRKLRRFGNNRIGLVMLGNADERSDYNWAAGLSIFNGHIPASRRVPMLSMKDEKFDEFAKWFFRYRPDAIVGLSKNLPEWLARLKLKVPEDVQVAILDKHPTDGEFAGIDQHHEIAGAVAVDMLLGQMYLNECGVPPLSRTMLIEGSWVDGPSAGKRG